MNLPILEPRTCLGGEAKENLFILPWRLEEGGAPRLGRGWGVLIEDYILEDLRKVVFGGMHVWGLGLGFRDS
jgi:hypothetical protein